MLTRLHVQGYKALRNVDTTLEPLTVLVGPNGCGKTSVLESIGMLRCFLMEHDDEARRKFPFQEIVSKLDPVSPEIKVHLWANVQSDLYRRVMGVRVNDTASAEEEEQEVELALSYTEQSKTSSLSWHSSFGRVRQDDTRNASFLLGGTRSLELDVKAIARPSYSREIVPHVGADGSGLATVLSWLQGEQHEKFEEIQSQLREFVPDVERVRTRRAPVPIVEAEDVPIGHDEDGRPVYTKRSVRREEIGNEILLDFRHAKGVPARHASEGTLLLLGLLTITVAFNATTLLLDDVDRALHPKAQQQLIGYLRKLTERGVQTIATSHSPYLVLHLEYEEVRAMMASDAGGALIGKLTEHPEYERWREDMTPSEFWTVFGEEWLAKARTKAEGNG